MPNETADVELFNKIFNYIVENNTSEICKLLKSGDFVNISNVYGNSPLIWASYFGRIDIVKLFLEYGVDINFKDEYEKTSLHEACRGGYLEMAKILIDHGAIFNA